MLREFACRSSVFDRQLGHAHDRLKQVVELANDAAGHLAQGLPALPLAVEASFSVQQTLLLIRERVAIVSSIRRVEVLVTTPTKLADEIVSSSASIAHSYIPMSSSIAASLSINRVRISPIATR